MDIGLIAGQAGQALLAIDILNGDDTPDLEIGRCRCGLGCCDQRLDCAIRQGLISERLDAPVIQQLLDDLIRLRGRRDVSCAVAGTELGLCVDCQRCAPKGPKATKLMPA